MKRCFQVKLSMLRYPNSRYSYEVIAGNAVDAIRKAEKCAKKETLWGGGFVVEYVEHRGPVI